jgi:acetylornithine/N-succinyldiaminopimelate aminotransferase
MTARLADAVELGDHGGTYCGNPLSCAVAAQVIRYLNENRIADKVEKLGIVAIQDLQRLRDQFPDTIKDVRVLGLMMAIELNHDHQVWPLTEFCQQRGMLVTPTKNAVVRLLPSLLLTQEEWREGVSRLESALSMLAVTQVAVVSPGGLR